MYKLEFTLKQHTPLIHFQHDQAGATLRATEVKPKLDFFIMKKLLNDPNIPDYKIRDKFYEKAMTKLRDGKDNPWKNWLVGKGKNEHVALDYKMSIECVDETYSGEIQEIKYDSQHQIEKKDNKIKTGIYPCFFGNTGKEEEDELKWYSWSENIKLKIHVLNHGLAEIISHKISSFIFFTNFGTRQSKGFGSFSVLNEQCKPIRPKVFPKYFFELEFDIEEETVKKMLKRYNTFYPDFKLEKKQIEFLLATKKLFDNIDILYRALRSGINIPFRDATPCQNESRFYFKSLLFYYFKDKGIQWDKKTIKEYFYFSKNPNHCLPKQKSFNKDTENPLNYTDTLILEKKKLIRDLLGLSTEQKWISYMNDSISKESKEKNENEPKYGRFKSPLTFKPVRINKGKYKVYIISNSFPDELKSKTFLIKSHNNSLKQPLSLAFPDNFDLNDYLNFVLERKDKDGNYIIDIKKYVNNHDFEEQDEFFKIEEMFNQIRANL